MKPEYNTPFAAALCYAFAVCSLLSLLVSIAMLIKGDLDDPMFSVLCAISGLIWAAIGQIVERPFKKDHEERMAKRGGFTIRQN